jgi:hypothetical protein
MASYVLSPYVRDYSQRPHSQELSREPATSTVDQLSRDGSFDSPTFIGTKKVPKGAFDSECNLARIGCSVFSDFVEGHEKINHLPLTE